MHLKSSITIASILFVCLQSGGQTLPEPKLPQMAFPFPVQNRDTVQVMIIGDVMMHSRQMEYDYHSFLENIRPALSEADFAVANMEFPLAGEPYTGYPAFSAPDGYEEYVADCGVDVFLMANNHLLDKRETGLERTLARYRSMSPRISFTGAAGDPDELDNIYPLMISSHGIRIALLDFCYGSNAKPSKEWPRLFYTDRDEIQQAIERARSRGADFIVALPHWGIEYKLIHSQEQEDLANWLAGNGVDVIVGSHPHVVQDSTHIGNVPVIYSVGNAISNMSAENTRLELAVTLRFVASQGEKVMLEPQLRFMWCTLPGKLTDSYSTIFVDEWMGRRAEWLDASDYDNMVTTLKRVQSVNSTGK